MFSLMQTHAMDERSASYEQHLRVMQVIAGALSFGAVVFVVVAIVLRMNSPAPPIAGEGISLFLAGFAGVLLVIHLIVPVAIVRPLTAGDGRLTEGDWLRLLHSITVTRLAILEGATFLNVVAFILQHNWWSLAITGGLLLWMLPLFPTRTRVEHWIETQQLEQR